MPMPPQIVDLATLILLTGITVYGYLHVRDFYQSDDLKNVVTIIMFLIMIALVLNMYDLLEIMIFG